MKKMYHFLFLLTFLLVAGQNLIAQLVTIPIGNPDGGNTGVSIDRKPYGCYFGYERTALKYSKLEIGTAGTITSVGFYVNALSAPNASTPVKIYIKEVSDTTFALATSFSSESAGATLVYDGTVLSSDLAVGSWVTKTLSTPFVYTGTNHLEVLVETNITGTGGESSAAKQFRLNGTGTLNQLQYWVQDNTAPTGTGTLATKRTNIQLNITPNVACSGKPTAGVAVASSPLVCPNSNVNVSLTGSTVASGLTYQWFSSLNGVAYSVIVGAVSNYYSALITDSVYLKCKVTCGGLSDTSSAVLVKLKPISQCYCNTALGGSCGSDDITNVTLVSTTLNNTSTCYTNAGGDADTLFPATGSTTAVLTKGISYTLNTAYSAACSSSVWIDFNQNGSFESSEWTSLTTSATSASVSIFIPFSAKSGNTVMRIRTRDAGSTNDSTSACTEFFSGETEDYVLTIIAATGCLPPTPLFASSVTSNSASLNWTENGTATKWQYETGVAGFTFGTGNRQITNSKPVSFTGLSANTSYSFYVRAICGPADTSVWSGPYTFTTLCASAALPWTESFESLSNVGLGIVPSCWSVTPDFTTDSIVNTFNRSARTGKKYLYTKYSASDWAYTPYFSLNAGAKYQFSFWYKTDGLTGWDSVYAAVGGSQIASAMVTRVGVPVLGSTDTVYKQYIGYFTPTTSGAYTFGLAVKAISNPDYITFDDFNVSVAPSCTQPASLSAVSASSNSSLNWIETGTANTWQIQYGIPGFILGNGTKQTVLSKPYSLTGLNPTTAYSYYVRSICGAGDTSVWAGPFNFSTTCGPNSLPWTESFESMTNVGVGIAPPCWSLDGVDWTTDSVRKSYARAARTGNKYLYTNYGADDWAYTPPFSLTSGSTYKFSFWYKADGEAAWDSLYAAVGAQQSRSAMTKVLGTPILGLLDSIYHQYTTTFTPTSTGIYYFGVHVVDGTGSPWYMNFDDFNLSDISTGYHDMAPLQVILPLKVPNCGSDSTPIKIAVVNNGSGTETNIPVSVRVDTGGGNVILSGIIPSVAPGAKDTFLIGNINTSKGGIFTVIGKTALLTDSQNSNDSTIAKTYSFSAIPKQTNVLVSVKCFGDTSGSINMTLSGGSGISSSWSNGKTTEDLVNLAAGTYSDTVTNLVGCSSIFGPFVITQPSSGLSINSAVTNQIQNGTKGSINISVLGGTPPYKYKWTNNDTTEDLTNLSAGSYKVTVSDANGCKIQRTDTVKFIVTGIEEFEDIQLYNVYPNPNSGKFYVSVDLQSASNIQIEILSVSGQLIKTIKEQKVTSQIFEIEVPEILAGVYLIKLTTSDNVLTRRVLISK